MIKLIASDLDGTIIDENNTISKNNFDAIKAINDKNINFAICTGKTYPIIKSICSQFNANYGIFGNGNQIVNLKTGEEIYRNLLTPEQITSCLHIAEKHNLHIHLYTNKEVITEHLMYMDLRNYELRERKFYDSSLEFIIVKDIEEYLNSHDADICKLIISSMDNIDSVNKEISDIPDLSVSHIHKRGKYKDTVIDKEYEYLDITPKNTNKSNALAILGDYLNVNSSEIMSIGDGINDIEMVKNSGVGIAVANAYDELKQVASYTTENPAGKGGFAEAIYKFIEF